MSSITSFSHQFAKDVADLTNTAEVARLRRKHTNVAHEYDVLQYKYEILSHEHKLVEIKFKNLHRLWNIQIEDKQFSFISIVFNIIGIGLMAMILIYKCKCN